MDLNNVMPVPRKKENLQISRERFSLYELLSMLAIQGSRSHSHGSLPLGGRFSVSKSAAGIDLVALKSTSKWQRF